MQCKICFEKYDSIHKPYSLYPCSHSFCIKCLDALPHQECPKCKREIRDKQPNYDLIEAIEELQPEDLRLKNEIQTSLNYVLNLKSAYELKLIETYKIKEAKIDTLRNQIEQRTNELVQKLINKQDLLLNETLIIESEYNYKLDELKNSYLNLDTKLNEINSNLSNIKDVTVLNGLLDELKSIDLNAKTNDLDAFKFEDYEYFEDENKLEIKIINKVGRQQVEQVENQLVNDTILYELNEQSLTNPLLKSFRAHADVIKSLAVMSNNNIISGSKDKTIKIWNPQNGRLIRVIRGVNTCVRTLAVLSNNNIVSGSCANKIQIWNSANGSLIRTINGHSGKVNSIVILANDYIVSGSKDKTIKVWNSSTGEMIRVLKGHTGTVWVLKLMQNDFIVSSSDDRTIKIWNWETGELVRTINGHAYWINSLEVLANTNIVSASDDNKIRVWNSQTGELIRLLEGHTDSVQSLVSLNNSFIASGSSDKTIKIWNIETGDLTASLVSHINHVNLLVVLNSGLMISASHDKFIKIWDKNLL